jgi:lipopolysaccharide export system permease protein
VFAPRIADGAEGCDAVTFAVYLIREIGRTMAVMLGVLIALFASYSASGFLADAVNGLMPANIIAELIALKVIISLEVLIPVSLYISVVLAFGRLYSDSEITAMFALGVTPRRVMGIALTMAGSLAVLIAVLSLAVRPWAYQKSHELTKVAETRLDVDYMEAGTFYVGDHGNRVIFVEHRPGPKAPAQDVFVRTMHEDHPRIIYARDAHQPPRSATEDGTDVYLNDAHVYDLLADGTPDDTAMTAQQVIVPTGNNSVRPPAYSAVAASTATLAASHDPADVAELQWRFSTPLSTLLLGLLGVPLSRAKPRQSRYAKMGTAILIYSGYYLLCTAARTWVQHGQVGSFPGIWWAPALLALVLAAAVAMPLPGFGFKLRLPAWPVRLPARRTADLPAFITELDVRRT